MFFGRNWINYLKIERDLERAGYVNRGSNVPLSSGNSVSSFVLEELRGEHDRWTQEARINRFQETAKESLVGDCFYFC
jgi:hypothetical protein